HAPKAALGTTLSAYKFIGMSGSILATYVTGYLADTAGSMQVGFYLSCVLLILGLIAFSVLEKEDRSSELG
ncbi:MFS transporter, partial [Enterococcus faecalis]